MPIRLTQAQVRVPTQPLVLAMVTFESVLKIAAQVGAQTYRDLYESARAHPNSARSK